MRFSNVLALSSTLLTFLATIPSSTEARCCRGGAHGVLPVCPDGAPITPCCGYGKCNGFCCACPGRREIEVDITTHVGLGLEIGRTVITAPPGTEFTCRVIKGMEIISGRLYTKSHNTMYERDNCLGSAQAFPTAFEPGLTLRSAEEPPLTAADARPTFTKRAAPPSHGSADAPVLSPSPVLHSAPVVRSEFMEDQKEQSDCEATFDRISNGTGLVDLEGYLGFFGVPLHRFEAEPMAAGQLASSVDGELGGMAKRDARVGYKEMLIKHFTDRDVNGDGFLDKAEVDALM